MNNDSPSVAVTIEFDCEECGTFEVIKSKSTLIQHCAGCGKLSKPLRIVCAGINIDGVWKIRQLQD
jgi:hypothetical protein